MEILSAILTTIGTLLTLWSLIYARSQAKKVSDLKRNQNITLWATLSRLARSISDIHKITGDDEFIENGILTEQQKQAIPKIHRGLSDQYIRLSELIIQNDPSITKLDVENWLAEKRPGIETEWRKNQFVNLILAGSKNDSNRVRGSFSLPLPTPACGSALGGSHELPCRSRVMNVNPQFFDRQQALILEPFIGHT